MNINIDKQKKTEIKLEQGKSRADYLYRENELILNNITSVLVYINSNYEVQWTNSHSILNNTCGKNYKKGDVCYKKYGKDSPCIECPAMRTLKTHKLTKHEFVAFEDDIFEITAIPVDNEYGFEGIVLKFDNVTERKKLIDDLKNAKEKTEPFHLNRSHHKDIEGVYMRQFVPTEF